MIHLKQFLSLGMVIVALVLAFAFRPVPIHSKSPNANYWLKYDCSDPGQVERVPGNRTINVPPGCPKTSGIICARLYNENSLELDPDFPGQNIYRVKDGVQPILSSVYCP